MLMLCSSFPVHVMIVHAGYNSSRTAQKSTFHDVLGNKMVFDRKLISKMVNNRSLFLVALLLIKEPNYCSHSFFFLFLRQSSKGPPFKFFDTLEQIEVSKSPKGLPFQVSRHHETGSKFLFFDFSFFPRIFF